MRFLVLPAISMLQSWTEPVPVVSGVAFRKDDQTIHFLFSMKGCSLGDALRPSQAASIDLTSPEPWPPSPR
jgi:hypothetical protein